MPQSVRTELVALFRLAGPLIAAQLAHVLMVFTDTLMMGKLGPAELAAGGLGEARPLSENDKAIAAKVGPFLREKGLIFVGLDVIGNYVTEINVTSPTCVREIDAQFGTSIADDLFDVLEAGLAARD